MKRKSYILIIYFLMAVACGFSMPVATDLQSHGVTQNQIDSLADIMRLCHRADINFDVQVDVAKHHFNEESAGQ